MTEIWHGLTCVSTSLFGGPGNSCRFWRVPDGLGRRVIEGLLLRMGVEDAT